SAGPQLLLGARRDRAARLPRYPRAPPTGRGERVTPSGPVTRTRVAGPSGVLHTRTVPRTQNSSERQTASPESIPRRTPMARRTLRLLDADPASRPKPRAPEFAGRFRAGMQMNNRPVALQQWRVTVADPTVA